MTDIIAASRILADAFVNHTLIDPLPADIAPKNFEEAYSNFLESPETPENMGFLGIPTIYDFGMNQEDLGHFTESRQLV